MQLGSGGGASPRLMSHEKTGSARGIAASALQASSTRPPTPPDKGRLYGIEGLKPGRAAVIERVHTGQLERRGHTRGAAVVKSMPSLSLGAKAKVREVNPVNV